MLIGCAVQCYGSQEIDTTKVYSIPEVVVSDRYQTREVRSAVPLQIFSHEELKNLNVMQVSDAVKHFSGVTVKDYGGIGGLKTVSIRSLGAQHTVVGYDGIAVTDCQTGQVDIGRFSLENVDRLIDDLEVLLDSDRGLLEGTDHFDAVCGRHGRRRPRPCHHHLRSAAAQVLAQALAKKAGGNGQQEEADARPGQDGGDNEE